MAVSSATDAIMAMKVEKTRAAFQQAIYEAAEIGLEVTVEQLPHMDQHGGRLPIVGATCRRVIRLRSD